MIIAIDGYEANVAERVGIGRYAYEILRHLYVLISQHSALSTQHSFRVYLPSRPLSDLPQETSWWKYRVAGPRKFWTFVGLPLALLRDQPPAAVVVSPTHYIPRFLGVPRVMAIMDLSYLRYPEMFRAKDLHQLVHWTAYSVRHARKILTISKFSKNAIIEAYGVPRDMVVVTYPGVTMESKVSAKGGPASGWKSQISNVKKRYVLSEHYILSVGTVQPRKNYVRLIEAFSRLVREYPKLELVIVGKKGWLYEETKEAPKRFGVADRVKFLEFVPDNDLPAVYEGAICLALPSLYEGFGLPVLEAIAHRCPVVVSNTSSLPEIAGPAGIYVNPDDVVSIAQGLEQAVREHGSKAERDRIKRGLAHIKKFSWEKSAKKVLEILTEVAQENK